ncbi:pimelyl-ACP methyl ester esterase BioV [Sulfurimonas sp.]|nr:pimelyl-ACP methyl ester esterase BioV [Sulfurimonas sp.]
MKFYSGFSLKDEEYLFDTFIDKSEYTVCGFSYGSIKALEYVQSQLENSKRVDKLQLFSPVFFQTKSEKFKKLQTMGYTKDKSKYLDSFIGLCFKPHEKKLVEHCESSIDELHELLNYEWNMKELLDISASGTIIEVYLGGNDSIIDVESAREFFLHVGTVTYIKDANHFLIIN